jgi:hypothetical protein
MMSGRDPDKQYMTHPPALYGDCLYQRACLQSMRAQTIEGRNLAQPSHPVPSRCNTEQRHCNGRGTSTRHGQLFTPGRRCAAPASMSISLIQLIYDETHTILSHAVKVPHQQPFVFPQQVRLSHPEPNGAPVSCLPTQKRGHRIANGQRPGSTIDPLKECGVPGLTVH